jgi:hypothetical protein
MANLPGQRTFLQIKDEIASVLFNQGTYSTTSYPTTAMIENTINKYYKKFYGSNRWMWDKKVTTLNTVNGTKNVVMADDVMEVTNMNIESLVRKLILYPREKFKSVAPGGWTNIGNAVPVYSVEGQPASNNAITFDLWPAPDAVYTLTIDYYARITPMSASGDVSIIPPEFDDYLTQAPLAELLIMLGDQRAQYYKGEADRIMKAAWLRNENMAQGLNSWRDSATENLNVPWPGLVQPYAP